VLSFRVELIYWICSWYTDGFSPFPLWPKQDAQRDEWCDDFHDYIMDE
jgi:hypothetical protein